MCRSASDPCGGRRCTKRNRALENRRERERWLAATRGIPVEVVRQADPEFLAASNAKQVEMLRESTDAANWEVAKQSPVARVRLAALSHPLTPGEEAETALFSRDRAQVKAALLNPNLSMEALDRFAAGSPADRVKAVEAMERCGYITLTDLVNDSDPRVRLMAARKTTSLDHREHFLSDRATKVRLAVVERGGPIPLRYATEPVPEVRLAAGKHATNADLLHELAKDADPKIAATARSNPYFDPFFEPQTAPKRGSTLEKAIKVKADRVARSRADKALDRPDPSPALIKEAYGVANVAQKIALSKKPRATAAMIAEHFGSWPEGEQVRYAARFTADADSTEGKAILGAVLSTKSPRVLEAAAGNGALPDEVRRAVDLLWSEVEGLAPESTEADLIRNGYR